MQSLIDVLKASSVIVVPLMVALATGWWNKRAKEVDATATPYEQLARRVATLENQVTTLQIWANTVVPLHSDIVSRWDYYRARETPPFFPPLPRDQVERKD